MSDNATPHRTAELPSIPKLETPAAIITPQGIKTLRAYMKYMVRKFNLRPVHPFSFDDMFQEAYAFLLEHVDEWDIEKGMGFDSWATEMLRYGWLKAVKQMHWAGYRAMWDKYQIGDRRITRFGEDEFGRSEMDAISEPTDSFATLEEEEHLETLLSLLEDRDRRIVELMMEGYTGVEIDNMLGITKDIRDKARRRVQSTFDFERPARMKLYDELTEKDKSQILGLHKAIEIHSPIGRGSCEQTGARLRIEKSAVRRVVNESVEKVEAGG